VSILEIADQQLPDERIEEIQELVETQAHDPRTRPQPKLTLDHHKRLTRQVTSSDRASCGKSRQLGSTSAHAVTRHVQALSYPVLNGYALAGDFEGVLTLAIGLHSMTSVRVGELPGRGRKYPGLVPLQRPKH
jgi:hypothetical protein